MGTGITEVTRFIFWAPWYFSISLSAPHFMTMLTIGNGIFQSRPNWWTDQLTDQQTEMKKKIISAIIWIFFLL